VKKISQKQAAVSIAAIVLLLFVLHHTYNFYTSRTRPTIVASSVGSISESVNPEARTPIRLKIAKIGVDAAIEPVGVTHEGAMDTPKKPGDVAWYSPGAYPGAEGSAVMAGHLDDKNGKAAVFKDLHLLRAGDTILIEDTAGNFVPFMVNKSQIYDAQADSTEVFVSKKGAHLNLITCIGTWDKSKNSYKERLVVFADRIPE
jgi:sortase (surface protein transpeptidase)